MRSGDNGHRALSTLGERVSRRIEKAGNGADCLGKGGGLAGHGDEEMGACGEDTVSEPVAKSLQPLQYLLSNMVLNSGNDAISLAESAAADTTPEVLQAATIMFATLPIIMIYPFVQKYFVKGAMIGAVKG